MNNERELQEIIRQFKRLQVQQTALIERLEELEGSNERGGDDSVPRQRPATKREFAIGDRVRVKNPRPFQESVGNLTKIGMNRISVQGSDGKTIVRDPKNIIFADHE